MEQNLDDVIFDILTEEYKDKVDGNKEFKDYLQDKTKKELLSTYLSYGYAGKVEDIIEQIWSLQYKKKEDIIKAIIEFLDKNFDKIFEFLKERRFKEIKYIADKEGFFEFKKEENNNVSFDTIKVLKQLNFIFCKRKKDKIIVHMPKYIKDKIRRIDKCIYLDFYKNIIGYSIGMADTYGVIKIEDAYNIIKRDIAIGFEEYENIIKFFSLLELEPILYNFEKQAICNFNLRDDEIENFLLKHRKYTIYNESFYKSIGNGKYILDLIEYKQFRNFLKEYYWFDINDDEFLRGEIINDYIDYSQIDVNEANKNLKEVLDRYFEIDDLEKQEIIKYIEKIKNKMPIWKEGGKIKEKTDIPKVGRNEKCPCGSGKKYKNCHGKNV